MRPTPAYGRHVAGAGWSEAGAARTGESGGGAGRAVQLGRKGGGSAQQRLSPFPFLLNFFSQILSKFIWTNLKSFSPLAPKNKVVPKQKPYNFVIISKTKFHIEFDLQIKTSSRFLNKFILGIFV